MRFKTTGKVTNEIVLSGLNLILKKDMFFDVSRDKIGHHELVWSIHSGYVSPVDDEAQDASIAKKNIYVNQSKKTIVCSHLRSPLGPGEKAILLSDDPVCRELDKLVSIGIINKIDEIAQGAKNDVVQDVKVEIKSEVQKDIPVRKSFKKSSSSKKPSNTKDKGAEKKDNKTKVVKLNSDNNVIVSNPDQGTIFVGENNGELDLD